MMIVIIIMTKKMMTIIRTNLLCTMESCRSSCQRSTGLCCSLSACNRLGTDHDYHDNHDDDDYDDYDDNDDGDNTYSHPDTTKIYMS